MQNLLENILQKEERRLSKRLSSVLGSDAAEALASVITGDVSSIVSISFSDKYLASAEVLASTKQKGKVDTCWNICTKYNKSEDQIKKSTANLSEVSSARSRLRACLGSDNSRLKDVNQTIRFGALRDGCYEKIAKETSKCVDSVMREMLILDPKLRSEVKTRRREGRFDALTENCPAASGISGLLEKYGDNIVGASSLVKSMVAKFDSPFSKPVSNVVVNTLYCVGNTMSHIGGGISSFKLSWNKNSIEKKEEQSNHSISINNTKTPEPNIRAEEKINPKPSFARRMFSSCLPCFGKSPEPEVATISQSQ